MPTGQTGEPSLGVPAAHLTPSFGESPGRIGPYRIIRPLGQGGMGVVYLAEQTEPVRREVALKVLRTGVDMEMVVARFESERQALAVMEHPNITRVFDAGTTADGCPYFVMERVDGVPITEYATTHRLDTRQRVRLFLQVCRAVQHAHQKGIIHRDLKPSNVLVAEGDGEPVAKVIDFGIAKAVRPAAAGPGAAAPALTLTGSALGTPAYMSPEQYAGSGLDVDTRTDIYALGVLLYELLVGVLPFDTRTHQGWALLAHQLTTEPPAPSARFRELEAKEQAALAELRRTDPGSLQQELRGDLAWIVLKAMEKDRDRRYETAAAFAHDLERHLADEPVLAGPPSGAYRARKFVRRHRAGVAFTAALLLLLVGFSAAAAVQARRLARARTIAERRQAQAEDLIGFMLGDLRTRLTPIGRLDVLDDVGKKALAYFAAVPEAELSDEELFRRSQALRQIGEVRVGQGDLAAAMGTFQQSLTLAQSLGARDSSRGEWQVGLGASHFWVGYILWRQGDLDGALDHFVPYVRISERLVARFPDSLSYRLELAQAHSNIGSVKESKGDIRGALEAFRSSLAIKQELVRRDPQNAEWEMDLAHTHNTVAVAQYKLGDLAGAARSHGAELAIKQALLARAPGDRQRARYLASAHAFLASLYFVEGKTDSALAQAEAARAIYLSLVEGDSANAGWRRNLANSERLIGQILVERGDGASGLRELESSRRRLEQLLATRPDNRDWQQELGRTQALLGNALLLAGRAGEAAAVARQALAVAGPALERRPGDLDMRRVAGEASLTLGDALARGGDAAGAARAWGAAAAAVDSAARASGQTDLVALAATALLRLDRLPEARPLVQDLARRGYRRPRFVALCREKGVELPSAPPQR